MATAYSDEQLRAFLEEGLAAELMSRIEVEMRSDAELCDRVIRLAGEREAGVHSLGEIWRRHRMSCPTRQQLGSYLLGALDEAWSDYIRFHLEQVGCRVCQANFSDLSAEQAQLQAATELATEARSARRRKYFQSSAGYLHRDR
ncbi:MAG: hypothetical protein ACTHK7_24625 [Aureliella sp.]